jgi:hypothetical protein
MHHSIPGLHLAVRQRARKLELCRKLVEHWRHDCYVVAGDGLSIRVCLGASEGEGEEGEECVS